MQVEEIFTIAVIAVLAIAATAAIYQRLKDEGRLVAAEQGIVSAAPVAAAAGSGASSSAPSSA